MEEKIWAVLYGNDMQECLDAIEKIAENLRAQNRERIYQMVREYKPKKYRVKHKKNEAA